MRYLRVMVLVPTAKELVLEEALKKVSLCCMHFLKVRGYGCDPNFYERDWTNEMVKFELVIPEKDLDAIKNAIKDACQTGAEDDGIVAVSVLSEMTSINDL